MYRAIEHDMQCKLYSYVILLYCILLICHFKLNMATSGVSCFTPSAVYTLFYSFIKPVLSIYRHHGTAHGGRVFGCHGDVRSATKLWRTLLRVLLRLFMIIPALE